MKRSIEMTASFWLKSYSIPKIVLLTYRPMAKWGFFNRKFSDVCRRCNCRYPCCTLFTFLCSSPEMKHYWVKGIEICSNVGQIFNSSIVKIPYQRLNNLLFENHLDYFAKFATFLGDQRKIKLYSIFSGKMIAKY